MIQLQSTKSIEFVAIRNRDIEDVAWISIIAFQAGT